MLRNFRGFLLVGLLVVIVALNANVLKYASVIKVVDKDTQVTFDQPMSTTNYIVKVTFTDKKKNINMFKVELKNKTTNGFTFNIYMRDTFRNVDYNRLVKNVKVYCRVYTKK